jgi:undecaprenyl diphosphate synthase
VLPLLDEVLDWCGQLAILAVTLWVFSTENFERPTEEVSGILAAMEAKMRSLADGVGSVSRFRFPGGLWVRKGKRLVIAGRD